MIAPSPRLVHSDHGNPTSHNRPTRRPRHLLLSAVLVAGLGVAGSGTGAPSGTAAASAAAVESEASAAVAAAHVRAATLVGALGASSSATAAPRRRVRASRSGRSSTPMHHIVRSHRPRLVVADSDCSGEDWRQRRVTDAVAALRADVLRPGEYQIQAEPGRRSLLGLTHLDEHRIEIFVRSCQAESDSLLRHVVAHELGHAFDWLHMTDSLRARWKAARGISAGAGWFGCDSCADFATPAGDFAETYAQWARGSGPNRSRMAGTPGPSELSALAAEFFHR